MIAYCDNANAVRLHNTSKSAYAMLVERALGIPRGTLNIMGLREVFWNTGTHYYGPLPSRFHSRREFLEEAQRPMTGILVVGEAVSRYQGWVEGALESVEQVL